MSDAPKFPREGLVRLRAILAPNGPIPTSRANWWLGVKSRRFPQPTYVLGPRSPAWRAEDIIAMINEGRKQK